MECNFFAMKYNLCSQVSTIPESIIVTTEIEMASGILSPIAERYTKQTGKKVSCSQVLTKKETGIATMDNTSAC
jgi:hypothetical protein